MYRRRFVSQVFQQSVVCTLHNIFLLYISTTKLFFTLDFFFFVEKKNQTIQSILKKIMRIYVVIYDFRATFVSVSVRIISYDSWPPASAFKTQS